MNLSTLTQFTDRLYQWLGVSALTATNNPLAYPGYISIFHVELVSYFLIYPTLLSKGNNLPISLFSILLLFSLTIYSLKGSIGTFTLNCQVGIDVLKYQFNSAISAYSPMILFAPDLIDKCNFRCGAQLPPILDRQNQFFVSICHRKFDAATLFRKVNTSLTVKKSSEPNKEFCVCEIFKHGLFSYGMQRYGHYYTDIYNISEGKKQNGMELMYQKIVAGL